jgi:hypothetical protein
MEAKEKAKELISKFKKITTYKYQEYAGARYSIFEHDIDTIKECCLGVITEIINSNPHSNPFNTDVYSTMDYWLEVKKEINNL